VAVSRRPPNPSYTRLYARIEGYTNDAKVWALSLVQGLHSLSLNTHPKDAWETAHLFGERVRGGGRLHPSPLGAHSLVGSSGSGDSGSSGSGSGGGGRGGGGRHGPLVQCAGRVAGDDAAAVGPQRGDGGVGGEHRDARLVQQRSGLGGLRTQARLARLAFPSCLPLRQGPMRANER
jgi:hypothetical protein